MTGYIMVILGVGIFSYGLYLDRDMLKRNKND